MYIWVLIELYCQEFVLNKITFTEDKNIAPKVLRLEGYDHEDMRFTKRRIQLGDRAEWNIGIMDGNTDISFIFLLLDSVVAKVGTA